MDLLYSAARLGQKSDAPAEQHMDVQDLSAHLQFLPVAFRGPSACAWQGQRSFLIRVEGTGEYVVTADASESGLGVSVAPWNHVPDPGPAPRGAP